MPPIGQSGSVQIRWTTNTFTCRKTFSLDLYVIKMVPYMIPPPDLKVQRTWKHTFSPVFCSGKCVKRQCPGDIRHTAPTLFLDVGSLYIKHNIFFRIKPLIRESCCPSTNPVTKIPKVSFHQTKFTPSYKS